MPVAADVNILVIAEPQSLSAVQAAPAKLQVHCARFESWRQPEIEFVGNVIEAERLAARVADEVGVLLVWCD
jgi:hypothetical protein